MRDIVGAFLARAARDVVLPASLGIGLALSGCGDDRAVDQDGSAVQEAGVMQELGPQPAYAAPMPDGGPPGLDGALYAAPFPDALYAAPFPDGGTMDTAMPDLGGVLYAGPFPDAAVTDTAAPSVDTGAGTLYAAPFPDAAAKDSSTPSTDLGAGTLYAAPFPDAAAKDSSTPSTDLGPGTLYAAPFPDASAGAPKYAAAMPDATPKKDVG